MSIYATWLDLSDDEQEAVKLAAEGIAYYISGTPVKDAPYVYQGSHIIPTLNDPQAGYVAVSMIPNHVILYRNELEETPENLANCKADFIRLDVSDDTNTTTVVLSTSQVEQLQETLKIWLDTQTVN